MGRRGQGQKGKKKKINIASAERFFENIFLARAVKQPLKLLFILSSKPPD